MSIFETALNKGRKSYKRTVPRRSSDSAAEQIAKRARQASEIDPELRLRPHHVHLDAESCRERRILLPSAEAKDGAAVAAYRMLRTRLLHRARTNQWTTIALTSAGANDGKTLTAINLALSMAREKTREIVLLDLDMRNPSVCRTLGITPPLELRHYLETGEDLTKMFVSVGDGNLLIGGSLTPTVHASELLSSPRFDDMLGCIHLGAVEPIILIDLPPVLLTDDALVVAPRIDSLLVVAANGNTSKEGFERALALLAEFPIAGVVLNKVAEKMPYYNYGYDSAGQGPGSAG
jgi:protein-tyrosine kinase